MNWEWIIRYAKESGDNVVIVSRDSDYGISFENERLINDWLLQEFRERVSRTRKLILTDRLSVGLKQAGILVTDAQVKAEEELLDKKPAVQPEPSDLVKMLLEGYGSSKVDPEIGSEAKIIIQQVFSALSSLGAGQPPEDSVDEDGEGET